MYVPSDVRSESLSVPEEDRSIFSIHGPGLMFSIITSMLSFILDGWWNFSCGYDTANRSFNLKVLEKYHDKHIDQNYSLLQSLHR